MGVGKLKTDVKAGWIGHQSMNILILIQGSRVPIVSLTVIFGNLIATSIESALLLIIIY